MNNLENLHTKSENYPFLLMESTQYERTEKYNIIIFLYMHKFFDVNYSDERNDTILTKLFICNTYILDSKDILFIRKLLILGYNKFDINLTNIDKIVRDEILKYQQSRTNQIFTSSDYTNNIFISSGSYGDIYMTYKISDSSYYAIKMSKTLETGTDIYKEFCISKYINSIISDVAIKIFGFYISSSGKQNIVMEYAFFNLNDYLNICKYLDRTTRNKLVINLFREIFKKYMIFNQLGFLHFDVKAWNIVVMPDLTVRIIDFGLTIFQGFSRTIENFTDTYVVKPPDDPSDLPSKNYILKKPDGLKVNIDKLIFYSDDNCSVSYSSDLFSLACILANFVIQSGTHIQLIYIGDKFYKFQRLESTLEFSRNTELIPLTQSENSMIHNFSPFLYNFFIDAFCHDSRLRINCRDALQIFSGDYPIFQPKYSISLFDNRNVEKAKKSYYLDDFYNYHLNIFIEPYIDNNIVHKIEYLCDEDTLDNFTVYCNICRILGKYTDETLDDDLKSILAYHNGYHFLDIFYKSYLNKGNLTNSRLGFFYLEFLDIPVIFFDDMLTAYTAYHLKYSTYDKETLFRFHSRAPEKLRIKMQNITERISVFQIFDEIIFMEFPN